MKNKKTLKKEIEKYKEKTENQIKDINPIAKKIGHHIFKNLMTQDSIFSLTNKSQHNTKQDDEKPKRMSEFATKLRSNLFGQSA